MSGAPLDVTVIIVNFKGRDVTADCIRSVQASARVRTRIVVVDNASGDGSAESLAAWFPGVEVVAEAVNRGYPGGNNTGLARAVMHGSRYAFILNNDTILDPECLAILVDDAESHLDAALIVPRIFFHTPSDRLWFGGGRFSPWIGRTTHIGFRQTADHGLPGATDIPFATGCAVLVRMSAYRDIGVLDESLFGYAEDLDWSLRFRDAGHRLRYVPRAIVWHLEGFGYRRAGGQALRQYLAARNTLRVLRRHVRWYHWITLVPVFAIDHIARHTYLTLRDRDGEALRALYRGVWHAITGGRHPVEPAPRAPVDAGRP